VKLPSFLTQCLIASALPLLAACAPDASDSSAARGDAPEAAAVRASLAEHLPDWPVDAVRPSPVPGLYEIQVGMNFGYVTSDGRYLVVGDMTDLQTRQEITEQRKRQARLDLVNALGTDNTIEFAPENPKYTITVFTDVDCGYCRMLHKHMAEYNADGIAVRYAFFPRTGRDTASFYTAEQVWCSDDRKDALTKAKRGVALSASKDCANPIEKSLEISEKLGLRGTPAIILPDGELLPGYYPPDDLLEALQSSSATATLHGSPVTG
jgi:thiol:disulfide interchange protein DsbC